MLRDAIIDEMALNSKIIRRLSRTKSSDVMHSSGYATAQNAGNFGSVSSQSFRKRQHIDSNRQIVQAYHHARVAQQVNRRPNDCPARDTATQQADNSIDSAPTTQRSYATGASARFAAQQGSAGANLTARQQMAQRFEANARPIPKSGGLGRR